MGARKRWGTGALLALGLTCACGVPDSAAPALDPAQVAGQYGQAGRFGYLTLAPGGEYECWVTNGISADGCGTFVGSGLSVGAWSCRGGRVEFTPLKEPDDLVASLAGAHATPAEGALVVTIEGREFRFPRLEPRTQAVDPGPASER